MLFLYPECILENGILWSAIDAQGREHWSQILMVGVDPQLYVSRISSKVVVLCEASDERVIQALVHADN
jgi:hypothetical protein